MKTKTPERLARHLFHSTGARRHEDTFLKKNLKTQMKVETENWFTKIDAVEFSCFFLLERLKNKTCKID